jgi:hypothetical protein
VAWTKLRGVPNGFADENDEFGPRAFAHVSDSGAVNPALAYGLDSEDVHHPASEEGVYCFTLPFDPQLIQVTRDQRLESGPANPGAQPFASFHQTAINTSCSAATDANAIVIFRDALNIRDNAAFFVSFM